jgi:hypothetical protein
MTKTGAFDAHRPPLPIYHPIELVDRSIRGVPAR